MKFSSVLQSVLLLHIVHALPQGEGTGLPDVSTEDASAPPPDNLRDLSVVINGDKLEEVYCAYDYAYVSRIRDGMDHLHKHKKPCNVPAGDTVRVSCSYNSAIYVYNSATELLKAECAEIADVANEIIVQCEWYDPGFPPVVGGRITPNWVGGKIPTNNNYTVEIRHDYC